jgi:hypothetical protein
LETGALFLAGKEEGPPDWWQFSVSAIGTGWLSLDELSQLEAAAMNLLEPSGTTCAQPMTQPQIAIHNETTVAIPLFTVRSGKCIPARIRIFEPLYDLTSVTSVTSSSDVHDWARLLLLRPLSVPSVLLCPLC